MKASDWNSGIPESYTKVFVAYNSDNTGIRVMIGYHAGSLFGWMTDGCSQFDCCGYTAIGWLPIEYPTYEE